MTKRSAVLIHTHGCTCDRLKQHERDPSREGGYAAARLLFLGDRTMSMIQVPLCLQ